MALKIKSQNNDFGARWFDYEGDVSFKICGVDKDEYRIGIERARRLTDRKESRLDLHNLSIDAQDRAEQDIQIELIGRYLIRDWRGSIENEDGEAVLYSPEQAIALLRSVPSLWIWVISKAIEVKADVDLEQEEIVGKPSPASSGSETGESKPQSES